MNSTEVLYESAYVSPRPAPKIVLKKSWQSRCEDDPQTEERGRENLTSSAGRPAAKTRYALQSGLQYSKTTSRERANDARKELISRRAHQIKNHPNKDALLADMQQDHPYNLFNEKSKEMIHIMGNVDFEMYEISPSVKIHICCRQ